MNNNWPPDSLASKEPNPLGSRFGYKKKKGRTGRKWTLGISVPITQRRIAPRWFCSPFWWAGRKVVASSSGSSGGRQVSKFQVQGMNRFKRTSFSLCVLGGRGGEGRFGGR